MTGEDTTGSARILRRYGSGSGSRARKMRGQKAIKSQFHSNGGSKAEGDFLWVRAKAGWRACVPGNELRREILKGFHDHVLARHPEIDKTRLRVRRLCWWPKMGQDIEGFVKSCIQCARGKASHLKNGGLLQPLPVDSESSVGRNQLSSYPRTTTTEEGYDAPVTVMCRDTKVAHFVPARQAAATEDSVRILIKDVVELPGVPPAIVSDRGTRLGGGHHDHGRDCVKPQIVNGECRRHTVRKRTANPDALIRQSSKCYGVVCWGMNQDGPTYYLYQRLRT